RQTTVVASARVHATRRPRQRPHPCALRRGVRGVQPDHANAVRETRARILVARQRHDPRRVAGRHPLAPEATPARSIRRLSTVVLFVYGTLAPGQVAWSTLAPHARATWETQVDGHLYDTGRGYPAAVFGTGTGRVAGWCCELADF